jgi:hypothetical protein
MFEIFKNLEPRYEEAGTIIFEELQSIDDILFISRGTLDVGFEINRKKTFVMRYTNKIVVGAFNCTF